MASKAKAKKFKLTYHTKIAKTSVNDSNELRHKSTQYVSSHPGQVNVSTSFLSTTEAQAAPAVFPTDLPSLDDPFGDELPGEDAAYIQHLDDHSPELGPRKNTAGDNPMATWLLERDRFIEELLTLEGRGPNARNNCSTCEIQAVYFCVNRASSAVIRAFLVTKWNGRFFAKTSLKTLGLIVQLGHPRGSLCTNPLPSPGGDFIVIDTNGIHEINLYFCGCGQSNQLHTVQLLRSRLYPATTQNPKTATTFRALEQFELLSYVSKVSAFEYYQSLERLIDNTGIHTPKDRYPGFLLSIRQWRYLRMMKRSGRGHDPSGAVAGTKEGDCAVLCPACPQPGINLPPNWEDAPRDKRYLYALFLGIDANFRLKRKHVSSDDRDPDIGRGFAYFVEEKTYKEYLKKNEHFVEPKSTCSRHNAVNLSNAKPGVSHAATGVGTVECARHNMKRPNAVGDLQFGERYINMDYLFYRSLSRLKLQEVYVSYDICCQWSIHLRQRMLELDPKFFLHDDTISVKFAVPKFHLPAHVEHCRTSYSLNFTVGAARTDGEAPERGWAEVNPLASSTKEMGPGSRRDCMDAHFGDYNWRKIVAMGLRSITGRTLYRKAKAAASDMAEHTIIHDELTATLPQATVVQWTQEVEAWERTQHHPLSTATSKSSIANPYDRKIQ
ncbi:hypothetical protein H0H92_003169, partial [Tricholoma furcatifolium]